MKLHEETVIYKSAQDEANFKFRKLSGLVKVFICKTDKKIKD